MNYPDEYRKFTEAFLDWEWGPDLPPDHPWRKDAEAAYLRALKETPNMDEYSKIHWEATTRKGLVVRGGTRIVYNPAEGTTTIER